MTASAAIADLDLAAGWARDLHDRVGAAVDDARLLCHRTAWRAPSATAFHDAVTAWTSDLVALRLTLSELEDEATAAAAALRARVADGLALAREAWG